MLHDAEYEDRINVKKLITDGTDSKIRDFQGETLIHKAMHQKHPDVVTTFIKSEAGRAIKDNASHTLYDEAAIK